MDDSVHVTFSLFFFCIFLYKSQKWDFWVKDMNIILCLPNCLPERLCQFIPSLSSAGLTPVVPQPCQRRPLWLSLLAELIDEKWFSIFDFAFLSITGKVKRFPICSFPDDFFLVLVVCSYALSIYLLVGGDFSVFLPYLYDKGEGSSG